MLNFSVQHGQTLAGRKSFAALILYWLTMQMMLSLNFWFGWASSRWDLGWMLLLDPKRRGATLMRSTKFLDNENSMEEFREE